MPPRGLTHGANTNSWWPHEPANVEVLQGQKAGPSRLGRSKLDGLNGDFRRLDDPARWCPGPSTMKIRRRTFRRWFLVGMGGMIFASAGLHYVAESLHWEALAPIFLFLEAAGFWIQDILE